MDKMRPSSKRYPPELKDRAVRNVQELRLRDPEDHGIVARVARQLGVGTESLRLWVKQAEIDAGRHPGTTSADHDELVELRKEVKELRRANDILQSAATSFGAEWSSTADRRSSGARPPTKGVVAFIDAHRDCETRGYRWGVEPICEQLQVAPSTYYDAKSRPLSARAVRDAVLLPILLAIWEHNYSVYGRRKLTKAAQRDGMDIGRDQVARLMAVLGIEGATRAKKRFTTKADPAAVRAPDPMRRHFTASRPDELWVADFTYCSTWSGIVYVAFIIDVFSRRLVGWKAARSMTADLVVDALNMAAWNRRHTSLDGLICHTDAGSQLRFKRS